MKLKYLGKFVLSGALVLSSSIWASAQEVREISIAIPSKSLVAGRPLIAEELGLFEKHGLAPRFVFLDASASVAASALISGSVDFAVTIPPAAINAQANGQDVVLVANNYGGLSGSLILAKEVVEGLGVSPTDPIEDRLRALDGLLLASTSQSSNLTTAYNGAAVALGAEPRFTFMAVSAMVAALESGAVQGFVATAPAWTQPILNDTGVLWISAPAGELPPEYTPAASAAIATMRDYAMENPAITASVASVYNDLSEMVETQPDDVRAAIAKLFPDLSQETVDLIFSMESAAMAAKPLTPEDMEHEITLLKLNGVLEESFSLDPASLLITCTADVCE